MTVIIHWIYNVKGEFENIIKTEKKNKQEEMQGKNKKKKNDGQSDRIAQ